MFRFMICLFTCLHLSSEAYCQTYTWEGPYTPSSTTNWSAGSWSGGVPPSGGGSSVILNFSNPNGDTTGYNTLNNLGNNFQTNQMNFSGIGGTISINTGNSSDSSVNTIKFSGSNAQVNMNSYGLVNLNYANFSAATTIAGSGTGEIDIAWATFGATVTVDRPTNYQNLGFTTFSNLNTASGASGNGSIIIQAGNIRIRDSNSLSTGNVIVNGGTFVSDGASTALPNNFTLNANFYYGGDRNNPGGFLMSGVLSGNGGVIITDAIGYGTLTLYGTNTFQGPLGSAICPTAGQPRGGALGDIYLVGPNATILNSSGIQLNAGGSVTFNNAIDINGNSSAANNNNNRITSTTPVSLSGASFNLIGGYQTGTQQVAGALTISGDSVVSVDASQTGNTGTTLTFASLSRSAQRGTILFEGNSSSFGDAPGAGVANIYFSTAPTSDLLGGGGAAGTTTISILPYAIAQTQVGNQRSATPSLVTYGSTGIRPLASSEYAASVTIGASTYDNVLLTSSLTLGSSPTSINSLTMNDSQILGTGTLQVKSGVVLFLQNGSGSTQVASTATLDFNGREAQFFVQNDMLVSGIISNANGLTKSGPGTLYLSNTANNIGGPLTVNSGFVSFMALSALGNPTSIALNSGNGSSYYSLFQPAGLWDDTGASSITLSSNITLNSGYSSIRTDGRNFSGPVLTLSGVISGSGGLSIYATQALSGGIMLTNTNNTFSGPIRIYEGSLWISSDAALGNAPQIAIESQNDAGIVLNTNWTTSRQVVVMANATGIINTNGFNATLNSPLGVYGNFGFNKNGLGILTLTQPGYLDGDTNASININSGELRVASAVGSTTSTLQIKVNNPGTLSGTGMIAGPVSVASGGAITPGNGDIGALAVGTLNLGNGLTLSSGAIVGIKIADASTAASANTGGSTDLGSLPYPTHNNFIYITGGTTSISSGTTFNVDASSVSLKFPNSYSYLIAQGAGNVSSLDITNQTQFTTTNISSSQYELTVTGDSNGDIYLNFIAVPEPGFLMLIGSGMGLMVIGQNKRKKRSV
ncbi:hypothetical protein KIH39_22030 [Telmatocola sphagniphila]|uniref:PEP-CTERM protein-sorting domain-containing protein n=1 Tax=Telmatocola sphagniphila TaxID=1123043 RepID=A0A8E6B422_9BACT|nr:hypothetical protein [Telmatocola sphagniphila]QVL31497.1 hypothetical protein KIH39_22030 [Telmatocola sphagniphila]